MLPKGEEMVLLSLLKGGPDTTAGDIQAAMSEALGKEQSFGSIFTALERLSRKNFVNWRKGTPDESRGGRAPRLYTITGAGRATLIASLRATQNLARGIDPALPLPVPAVG